jgi:hypothetical protein
VCSLQAEFLKIVFLQVLVEVPFLFGVYESVHRDTTMKMTNKMHDILIYYSKSALHVSGDVFAHYQEHLTVFTVSGSVHPSCCRLAAGSNLGEHYQIL